MSNHNEWPLRLQESVEIAGGGDIPKIEGEDDRNREKREKVLSSISEEGLRELYRDRWRFEMEMQRTREDILGFIDKEISENAEIRADLLEFFSGECANNDLECLTLIRFYGDFYRPDFYKEELYRHSLGVFRVAVEAYSSVLSVRAGGGEASLGLEERLSSEMGGKLLKEVRLEFFRASLMHDLGKISIPEFVVYNPITDKQSFDALKKNILVTETEPKNSFGKPNISFEEVDDILFRFSDEPGFPVTHSSEGSERLDKKATFSPEEREKILLWLEGKRVNPKMPVGTLIEMDEGVVFSKEERMKKILEMGIDPKTSFEEVLNRHERQSGILIGLIENDSILKGLAESHHNKEHIIRYLVASGGSGNEYIHKWLLDHNVPREQIDDVPPTDIGSSYLHIADVWEAVRARRAYKEPLPIGQSLAILVSETIRENLNSKVTGFFIDFQIGKNFGGETSDDHWARWKASDISPKFKLAVEEFLIREKVWIRS